MNSHLKEIAAICNIGKNLTTHVARHSWATAAQKHNIPISVISAGMGHASERTTQIYMAALENSEIDAANQRITTILTKCVSTQETIQMYINKC